MDSTKKGSSLVKDGRDEIIISHEASAEDIVAVLVQLGCPDLTSSINYASCSKSPVKSGGLSDIYQGTTNDGTKIAIKVPRQHDSPIANQEKAEILQRTAKELYNWSKLKHHNVLPLLGLAMFRDQISIITEWMEDDLLSYVNQNPDVDRISLCLDVCHGLGYIHASGVVHGDLKASNVLVSSSGTAMIAGFGNSSTGDSTLKLTHEARPRLSARWAAPELIMAEDELRVTEKSDEYAFGMIILEVLTGNVPYNEISESQAVIDIIERKGPSRPLAGVSDGMWELLQQCWAFEPSERPDMRDVAERLLTISSPSLNLEPDDSSSETSVETSSHTVPKLEADLYYHGLRGDGRRGPKLIYRTSKDVFTPPRGLAPDVRTMELLEVDCHEKLSENNLWRIVLGEIVKLLKKQQIKFNSVDFVRFRWEDQDKEGPRKTVTVTSRPTIWVGVLPNSTTGDAAFDSAQGILQLLKEYQIDDIDIAYRESTAQLLANSALLAPFNHFSPLAAFGDWITTALSLPIAGVQTLDFQGTLGFYFRIGDDLYGVTARHVLFPEDTENLRYLYKSGPKKDVVVMGTQAFKVFLAKIQDAIDHLNTRLTYRNGQAELFKEQVDDGDPQAAQNLADTQDDMQKIDKLTTEYKEFLALMKKDWSDVKNRVIGHVVWAPPISGPVNPYDYTQDVCVIKLDKSKFAPNFKGNVVDLGPEIQPEVFIHKMYPRNDAQSGFRYPRDRLFKLKKIMTRSEVNAPKNKDLNNDPVQYVIKRGHATFTTIGRLSGFESATRHCGLFGTFDSIEVAVLPYDNHSGPFSKGGDSGALIVGPEGEPVALLTGGTTGSTESSDITYGTLMEWLWDIIKAQFPGANLYFETAKN